MKRLRWRTVVLAALLAPAALSLAGQPRIDYSRQVRPILSDNCFHCHGPDERSREADLRLDLKQDVFGQEGDEERVVVPGNSGASLLVQRITASDRDERMPPPDSGKRLTQEQIALIRGWIDQGAEWKQHWAFVRPKRPPLPAVKDARWPRNPIDHFVLARLEKEGLEPSPPADRARLIRRLTLDLTGLPPTLTELDAFLADKSPDAYERLVARLLNSPRYGEHMAHYWLDAARYGDTHGLHLDNKRSIWPYRDWVIKAFNSNMPFDQFTIEQLAGDLLPGATLQQRIATGFIRCNVTTSEGGAIDEEFRVRYAFDRVETVATVWLGLTLKCARCHDHKFDPISQRDYYRLFAYFNSLADKAMDGNAPLPPPIVKVPTAEQAARQRRLSAEIDGVAKQIDQALAGVDYHDPGPEADREQGWTGEPKEYVWIDDQLPGGARAQVSGSGPSNWQFVTGPQHPVYSGKVSSTRSAKGMGQHFFTGARHGLRIGKGDKLFAYVFVSAEDRPRQLMLQFNDGTWEHRAFWGEDLIDWGKAGTASRRRVGPLPESGKWVRLEVDAAAVGLKPGATVTGWAFTQFDGTVHWDKAGLVTKVPQHGARFRSLLAWHQAMRAVEKPDLPDDIRKLVKTPPPKLSDDQGRKLQAYFLKHVYAETRQVFDPLLQKLARLKKELDELEKQIPGTLVAEDLPKPRNTYVLTRGQYDRPDKDRAVRPGTPAVLHPLSSQWPANRLGLARWLVDPANPLTPRVVVNRLWQQFFGTGIVKTAEDFGSQGEWPSHPKLLDWLAVELVESGWDIKHLQRLIVTSATYQQSSRFNSDGQRRDPTNRLLWRGPRFRMDAEMIRDTILAVSGLLVERIGGPSVKPPQPAGLWHAVAYTTSNTAKFVADKGQAQYRRSLYTFWKRTAPPPVMLTFDAPTREACSVRRGRTNTPLQALLLLNDQQCVEAARKLAERMMCQGGQSPEQRAAFAFRLATARTPNAQELELLVRDFEQHLADYQANPQAAQNLLAVGDAPRNSRLDTAELAAWTMVANVILNLDETITKQ